MRKVSLYIPTHNRATMLKQALDSALNQTYQNLEILVVDDGSTDDTAQLLAQYQREHGIRVLTNPTPQGACAARNRAIAEAQGELITGLDDDDLLVADHIENLVAHYDSRYAFVCASLIEDKGERTIIRNMDSGELTLDAMLYYNKAGNQVLAETRRVREVGGFDLAMPAFQDYDLWVRLIACYGPGLKLRTPSYILRTAHEHERISSSKKRRHRALQRFKEKHGCYMHSGHHRSLTFLEFHINGQPFGPIHMLHMLTRGNYKRVIMLYLKRNWPGLKRTIDALRHDR